MLIKQNRNVRSLAKSMLLWMLGFMLFNVRWSCTAHAADVAIKKDGISQIWSEAADVPGSYRMQEVKIDNKVIESLAFANLAAGVGQTVAFDLGPNYGQFREVAIMFRNNAGTITAIGIAASDDGVNGLGYLSQSTSGAEASYGSVTGQFPTRRAFVGGRYVLVTVVNGATAQGASFACRLVAYPS